MEHLGIWVMKYIKLGKHMEPCGTRLAMRVHNGWPSSPATIVQPPRATSLQSLSQEIRYTHGTACLGYTRPPKSLQEMALPKRCECTGYCLFVAEGSDPPAAPANLPWGDSPSSSLVFLGCMGPTSCLYKGIVFVEPLEKTLG